MNKKTDSPLGLTLGDTAGIGPEITLKLFKKKSTLLNNVAIIGNKTLIEKALDFHKIKLKCNILNQTEISKMVKGKLNILDIPFEGNTDYIPGKPSKESGLMAIKSIDKTIKLLLNSQISAMITNPVSKENIVKAGIKNFIGHTEYIAHATKTKHFNMTFAGSKGIVGLVTTHMALKNVYKYITSENIIKSIQNLNDNGYKILKKKISIAVLGLNPHAGENGLLGNEEITILSPAIKKCQQMGIIVEGPFPADSFWSHQWKSNKYNIVLAMYHDQGLIPVKTGLIGQSVNMTLGLPIIRTSVDHGTAFDIAGKGTAKTKGLETAIFYAMKSI